jgi:hypothetical protein
MLPAKTSESSQNCSEIYPGYGQQKAKSDAISVLDTISAQKYEKQTFIKQLSSPSSLDIISYSLVNVYSNHIEYELSKMVISAKRFLSLKKRPI